MRRLLLLLTAGVAALGVVAPPAQAAPAYTVTLTGDRTDVEPGSAIDSVVLSGQVTPAAGGQTVTLQRRVLGTTAWKAAKTLTLSKASRFSTVLAPTTAGRYQYRAVKAAGSGRGSGASAPVAVDVFRWRSLLSLPVLGTPTNTTTGNGRVENQNYPKSVILIMNGKISYGLEDCDTITGIVSRESTGAGITSGTFGIDNNGPSGGTGDFVSIDLTQGARLLTSRGRIWGLSHINIHASMTPTSGIAKAVFASPRVRCAS